MKTEKEAHHERKGTVSIHLHATILGSIKCTRSARRVVLVLTDRRRELVCDGEECLDKLLGLAEPLVLHGRRSHVDEGAIHRLRDRLREQCLARARRSVEEDAARDGEEAALRVEGAKEVRLLERQDHRLIQRALHRVQAADIAERLRDLVRKGDVVHDDRLVGVELRHRLPTAELEEARANRRRLERLLARLVQHRANLMD